MRESSRSDNYFHTFFILIRLKNIYIVKIEGNFVKLKLIFGHLNEYLGVYRL